jgi:hypothetical protein
MQKARQHTEVVRASRSCNRALRRVDEAREALLPHMGKARASSNSMRSFHFSVNREFAWISQAKISRKIGRIRWDADPQ